MTDRELAQWVVRKIGRALAFATLGPTAIFLYLVFVRRADESEFAVVMLLGTVACVTVGIVSLCFARAPR